MRNHTIPFLALFIANSLSAQNLPGHRIEPNTKFTLVLVASDAGAYRFSVEKKDTFDNTADLTKTSIFNNKADTNKIEGIFTFSKIKDEVQYVLVLKSGLQKPLDYELGLDTDHNSAPIKTSVVIVFPQMLTKERWPYQIHYIQFSNFHNTQTDFAIIQYEPIDSGCIAVRQNEISSENELSLTYIDTLALYLSNSSAIE